jgi:hypothetical protein
MLRIGLVAEGKSDWIVLEELIQAAHPGIDIEFERLRPDFTLVSRSPFGWKGVRAWCLENGPQLEILMRGVVGRPLHLLILHVDCSMAHNEQADRPCPPALDTADALRTVITQTWLARSSLPGFLVLATPSRSSDTWVVAALDPPYVGRVLLECDERAEEELVGRGLLRKKQGEVKKHEARYRPLCRQMASQIDRVCQSCSEAQRFRIEVATAISDVTT